MLSTKKNKVGHYLPKKMGCASTVDALPHSVFVSTQEMQQIMKQRQHVVYQEFRAKNESSIVEKLRKQADKHSKRMNQDLERNLRLVKEGKIKNETEESICKKAVKTIPSYSNVEMKDKYFVISEQKIAAQSPKELEEKFEDFKNPYSFPLTNTRTSHIEDFLKFMENILYPLC